MRESGRSDAKKFETNRKTIFGVFLTSLSIHFLFFIEQFVIMLMINKSDFRCTVVRLCYHSYDYGLNWTPLSPNTIAYYAHKELGLTCVARARYELLSCMCAPGNIFSALFN